MRLKPSSQCAVVVMTKLFSGNWITAKDLTTDDLTYQLVCKVLQNLQKASMIKSRMGPDGGYQIVRKDVSVLEIIRVFEDVDLPKNTDIVALDSTYAAAFARFISLLAETKLEHICSA